MAALPSFKTADLLKKLLSQNFAKRYIAREKGTPIAWVNAFFPAGRAFY